MMRDKSLSIWLTVLFGISGIAILMLAWLWPILESDRITAIFAGSAGLFIALARVLMLKHSPGRMDDKPVPVNVDTEDRP